MTLEKTCAVTNIIRWKETQSDDVKANTESKRLSELLDVRCKDKATGKPVKTQTNTKVVEWSDGTFSLAIGDQFFDIQMEP